jgi:type IV secretion system protein VirB6
MAIICSAPRTGQGFLSGTLDFLDCQAQSIGFFGYDALANPASVASVLLTSLLTIFVAIFGIRILMGRTPVLGDALSVAIKIGIVLALASSWAAYRVVVYDSVMRGPSELFSAVGVAAGLPGADGGIAARLQSVDDAVLSLVEAGTGPVSEVSAPEARGAPKTVSDETAYSFGRTFFVGGIIACLGLLRLLGGVLIALAPLIAGLLLFDATRAFFWGWVRALASTALGSLLVTTALAVELSFLEPWLSDVLATRAVRLTTSSAPFEFLAVTFAFLPILFGAIWASFKVGFALPLQRPAVAEAGRALFANLAREQDTVTLPPRERQLAREPQRASQIADRLAVRQGGVGGQGEQESGYMTQRNAQHTTRRTTASAVQRTEQNASPDRPPPLGQTYRSYDRRIRGVAARRSTLV